MITSYDIYRNDHFFVVLGLRKHNAKYVCEFTPSSVDIVDLILFLIINIVLNKAIRPEKRSLALVNNVSMLPMNKFIPFLGKKFLK